MLCLSYRADAVGLVAGIDKDVVSVPDAVSGAAARWPTTTETTSTSECGGEDVRVELPVEAADGGRRRRSKSVGAGGAGGKGAALGGSEDATAGSR
jgi:hypothetical protein